MASIPIYVPGPKQGGGTIPIYDPNEGGGTAVYDPDWQQDLMFFQPGRQRGGGGFRNMGSAALRFGRKKMSQVGAELISRGADAVSNVTEAVMDGQDLQQAVKDEGVKARVELKRRANDLASKASAISGTAQKKPRKYAKSAVNALFN